MAAKRQAAGTAIQVAYWLEGSEERETGSLLSFAQKKEGISRLIIVTDVEEKTIRRGGVETEAIPVHRFLPG
ncbi:MAG: hypothetical protein II837_00325 [Treponema sp.]|nr:hypothetical protein [Treponema sp.]MBQ6566042.1 hypothetical protein [Treponema sp.]MBQ7168084.1 hypothetical protein [Treponema sp.]